MIKQGRLDRKYGGIADCFKRTLADEGEHNPIYYINYFPQFRPN